jgi:subtilisin family serine protease
MVAAVALIAVGTAANADDLGTAHLWSITRSADGSLHVVRGQQSVVAAMNARLGRAGDQVLSTETDEPVHAMQSNDPLRPQQWALNAVPFEATWPVTRGAGVTVAVIDTGIAAAHQDLAGSVVGGEDLADDQASVDPASNGMVDPDGHGTHVAGVIAAHANNGIGVTGAAPLARLMPVRVLDANGTGVASNVAQGIIWAADHGARVMNLSLGGGPSDGMEEAIQYANSKGAVVVGAGGNSYQQGNQPTYPAAYPEAIAVAAVDEHLQRAAFSNTGSYIDLAAPGVDVLSTYGGSKPNDYEWMDGTSMATPFVSAAAALLIAENSSLSAARVAQILEQTANDLGAPGKDSSYGYGFLNPKAAAIAAMPDFNRGTKGNGYWVVTADGGVHTFGNAGFYGSESGKSHATIVAGARTPDGRGYWLAAADGAVYSFGDARYYGGMSGHRLNGGIVGMAAMPDGHGYILLGSDGGIFNFGSSRFYGSTGSWRLNAPVLDLTITATGHGYWFVAADGGIFTFGDAKFHGSTGSMRLNSPVRSMTATANGAGYWMVASDGGIFAFHAPFEGSLPGVRGLSSLIQSASIRMRALPSSDGYYILGQDGTVYAFGQAKWFGSVSNTWAVDLMQTP